MGRYNFQSPGVAAGNAIEQFLMQREMEQRQRVLDALLQKKQAEESARQQAQLELQQGAAGLQREQFTANEAERQRLAQRQASMDDVAAGERRQAQNQIGVRQMMAEGLRTGTADPRAIQLQAFGEGVDIPADVLDPGAAQRRRDAEDLRNHQQAIELARIQGEESRRTAAAGREAAAPPANRHETADTIALIDTLEKQPGFDRAYGVINSLTAPFSQDAQDAIGVRDQLVAALALPNMGMLKGPASDKDVAFIKQRATRLSNPRISPAEARRALVEARDYLKRRQAEEMGMGRTPTMNPPAGAVGGQFSVTAPNGKTYTFQSQREMESFKATAGIR